MTSTNEPVGPTCRTIDYIIENINFALYELECMEGVESVVNYLNLKGSLEEVRSANYKLRDWGNNLASEVISLRDKVSLLDDRINDLKQELDSY